MIKSESADFIQLCREVHQTSPQNHAKTVPTLCPFYFVGTEASGTSVHMAGSSIHDGFHPFYIGLPLTIGTSVGVGNLNTKGYALATKITLRHSLHLPSKQQL